MGTESRIARRPATYSCLLCRAIGQRHVRDGKNEPNGPNQLAAVLAALQFGDEVLSSPSKREANADCNHEPIGLVARSGNLDVVAVDGHLARAPAFGQV